MLLSLLGEDVPGNVADTLSGGGGVPGWTLIQRALPKDFRNRGDHAEREIMVPRKREQDEGKRQEWISSSMGLSVKGISSMSAWYRWRSRNKSEHGVILRQTGDRLH